jgi:hypothetical protein
LPIGADYESESAESAEEFTRQSIAGLAWNIETGIAAV